MKRWDGAVCTDKIQSSSPAVSRGDLHATVTTKTATTRTLVAYHRP